MAINTNNSRMYLVATESESRANIIFYSYQILIYLYIDVLLRITLLDVSWLFIYIVIYCVLGKLILYNRSNCN